MFLCGPFCDILLWVMNGVTKHIFFQRDRTDKRYQETDLGSHLSKKKEEEEDNCIECACDI